MRSASQRKRNNKSKIWKQDVPCDDSELVLEDWAKHLQAQHWHPGKWQPVHIFYRKKMNQFKREDKYPGALLQIPNTWNLYFYKGDKTIRDYVSAIEKHPLKAVGEKEPDKDLGFYNGPKWCWHDHLSPYDYGFRSRRNFSVLAGYTKKGDRKPVCGKQMTHFHMGITSGCKNEDDGGNWNMQLVANMMCEICGFDLPFPEIFYDEDLLQPPQPNLDHSAVGDFADPEHAAHHQSAVGGSAHQQHATHHQSGLGDHTEELAPAAG